MIMNESSSPVLGYIVLAAIVGFFIWRGIRKRAAARNKLAQAIAVQNIVGNTPSDKLILSPKQLANAVANYIGRHNKEMASAVERMNRADNPKAFFEQVDRINAIIDDFSRLEEAQPGTIQPAPGTMKKTVFAALPSDTNAMIDRAWTNAQLSAAKCATDNAKRQKYQAFFDTMDIYRNRMDTVNLDRLEGLRRSVGM